MRKVREKTYLYYKKKTFNAKRFNNKRIKHHIKRVYNVLLYR